MATVYISLGSNIGNRRANLQMALRGITRMARIEAVSSLYETEPQGPPQPPFYNAVCCIETGLEPLPLLRFLKALEQEIGRRPGGERWGPRPIDLDILLFEDRVLDGEELTIPHPRLAERAFVLVPLAEIGADLQHPATGEVFPEMAAAAEPKGVKRIAERGWDGVAGADQAVRL